KTRARPGRREQGEMKVADDDSISRLEGGWAREPLSIAAGAVSGAEVFEDAAAICDHQASVSPGDLVALQDQIVARLPPNREPLGEFNRSRRAAGMSRYRDGVSHF